MDHLKMQTKDQVEANFEILASLFPSVVTETIDNNGKVVRAIDAKQLAQEVNSIVVEDKEERYQFTWPDKRKAKLLANAPINATLRPCRDESVDFDNTKNLYIEGDNLDVLKCLKETYLGKVKMIYIDPPYNTGKDFVYEDDFAESTAEYLANSGQFDEQGNRLVANTENNGRFHTDWLNMIYPRLKVARDLLTDDGVIFISIDDNEVSNLRTLCDEVYGAANFIGIFSVENNPKGRKNSDFIAVSSEYCIVYAKKKELAYFIENVPKKASDMSLDENGRYVHNSGKRVLVGENSFNNVVSNVASDKNYSVYYRRSDKSIKIIKEAYGDIRDDMVKDGFVKYYSYFNGKLVENTYTSEKLIELFKEGALDFSSDKIYEKNFSDKIRIKSQLVNREYEAIINGVKMPYSMELTTTGGSTQVKSLFNELSDSPFSAPKNVGFMKVLMTLFPSDDFIVLDFFSGSATTAHAVMQLNAEDGGNRKFIMVQLRENLDENLRKARDKEKTIIKNAIVVCDLNNKPHVLTEVAKERIRRAGKKIKADSPLTTQELDTGFRVLKLDSTNMQDVYYTPADLRQDDLFGQADNIKPDRSGEDLLFQVMLELGILLDSKIEEQTIAGKKVFNVADGFLLACFDDKVDDAVVTAMAKLNPQYAVLRDSCYADDSTATNFEQIFKTYSPNTNIKTL